MSSTPTLNQPAQLTIDPTPDFSGTGTAGDTITIKTLNDATIATVIIPQNGEWSITSSELSEGTYTIKAIATNGSATKESASKIFTVDLTKPVFSNTTVSSDNAIVTVVMSEPVVNSTGTALEVTDFVFSITGGTATLASNTPTSILVNLNGTDHQLGLSLTGTANGSEILKVQPASGASIYDVAGNSANANQDSTNKNTVSLNSTPVPLPPDASCFPGNTPVQTDQGIVNICDLCPDKHTIRGNKIETVTQNTGIEDFLILIKKDTLYPNVPSQDTYITFDHNIFVNKQNVRAGVLETRAQESGIPDLMNRIYQVPYNGEVLYNVLLKHDKHDYMCVNNLIVETMNPNNIFAKYYCYLKNKKQGEKNSELEEAYEKYSYTTHALVKKHKRSRISKM